MRILFTSPVLEHPPAGGSQLRVENSIKALSQLCEMDIISRCPPSVTGGDAAQQFYRGYCTEFHVAPSARRLSANHYKRKLQRLMSLALGNRAIRQDVAYLLEHIDRRNISVVWFGYGNISFPLIRAIRRARPNLTLICDTDSVWSRFILRELPYASGLRRVFLRWAGARKEREEKSWVNLCDITTAVSEVDAEYYRSLTNDPSRVRVFSNVIDVDNYKNPPPAAANLKHPSIYLAGVYGRYQSPMDVAARWMLDEVLPLTRAQVPEVHFYLVGTASDLMYGHLKDPNITVTGKLPSVLGYLCHVDVALVPLKFESGTRYKILEAGACYTPLVSTTLGAEGLPVIDGEHLLIADTPQEFADAIVRLLRDKPFADKLARNCHALVTANYSIDTLKREATAILRTFGPHEISDEPPYPKVAEPVTANLEQARYWNDVAAKIQTSSAEDKALVGYHSPYDTYVRQVSVGLLDKFTKPITEKNCIAELGSGTGLNLRHFSRLNPAKLMAFDCSEQLLSLAQANLADLSNVTYVQTGANDLPVPQDTAIDLLFTVTVLQHIVEPALYASVVASMKNSGSRYIMLLEDTMRKTKPRSDHYIQRSPEEYIAAFAGEQYSLVASGFVSLSWAHRFFGGINRLFGLYRKQEGAALPRSGYLLARMVLPLVAPLDRILPGPFGMSALVFERKA